jgi:hypothetical protein
MSVVKTNVYEAAGEGTSLGILRAIIATIEKGADLQLFQLEALLKIVENDIAPLVMFAASPRLPFIYLAMKKIIENQINEHKKAQKDSEQLDYSYGWPATEELEQNPKAFDF